MWISGDGRGYTRPHRAMVQFNSETREIALKVVYYGPALSGKTTNLQALFQKFDPKVRGRLMTLDTKDDRTLFFDMMPVFFKTAGGVKVKLKLYTVPGQVMHESTRRIVLQGSDGVAFVADSRKAEIPATLAYWNNMLKNLEANGLDPKNLPIVIQANKKDLPDSRDDDMADLRTVVKPLVIPAVAIRGEGVVETLHILLTLCYRNLDRQSGLERSWKLSEREFLGQIFSHMDLSGTHVPRQAEGPR
jgi:signal recognition particle receptor subunit beta